jgi:DNA-binding NarL/FixJ family response regulator
MMIGRLMDGSAEGNVMEGQHKIRVMVEHKDAIVRSGLQAVLASAVDMEVSVAPPGVMAYTEAADVIITDYAQAMLRSNVATSRHARMSPTLIVTQSVADWDVHRAVTAGVQGYFLQSDGRAELEKAVRTVHGGASFLSRSIKIDPLDMATITSLTQRESDVLMLMGEGCCNKAIARELNIGIGTVKTHVKGAFMKLGVTTRTEAVVLGTRCGFIQHNRPSQPPSPTERLRC